MLDSVLVLLVSMVALVAAGYKEGNAWEEECVSANMMIGQRCMQACVEHPVCEQFFVAYSTGSSHLPTDPTELDQLAKSAQSYCENMFVPNQKKMGLSFVPACQQMCHTLNSSYAKFCFRADNCDSYANVRCKSAGPSACRFLFQGFRKSCEQMLDNYRKTLL